VTVGADAAADPGSYEGEVVLTSAALAKTVHVPVWLHVLPQNPTADVLLVDDDGSSADPDFTDYSTRYTNLLDSLGVNYVYVDPWTERFPALEDLYGYKLVILFTGDNDSFDTSGLYTSDQDALSEWLDSGGRLWVTGQNTAEETDSNADFDSTSLGRSRLYQGYLGLSEVADSAYPGATPRPSAKGAGPMVTLPTKNPDGTVMPPAPLQIDLGAGGAGAGNQDSIEVSTPMSDNDTYAAADTMTPFFTPLGSSYTGQPQTAIAWGRSSEPSLEQEQTKFRYRTVGMGFGMEAVNPDTGFARPKQIAGITLDWLLDTITFQCPVAAADSTPVSSCANGITTKATGKQLQHVNVNAGALSSTSAKWTRFRWDFGDKSKFLTVDRTTNSDKGLHLYASTSASHTYSRGGTYTIRVQATDSLGHSAIARTTVKVKS
jgi:hypothetical protein